MIRSKPQQRHQPADPLATGRKSTINNGKDLCRLRKNGLSVGHIPYNMIPEVHTHHVRVAPDSLHGERVPVLGPVRAEQGLNIAGNDVELLVLCRCPGEPDR
jgi:hypothetical protein